jgi:hypothetical protein
VPHDLRHDLRARDERLADQEPAIAMHQPHVIQLNRRPHISREAFDLNGRAVFDSILLSACLNDRVHVRFPPTERLI